MTEKDKQLIEEARTKGWWELDPYIEACDSEEAAGIIRQMHRDKWYREKFKQERY